MFTAILLWLYQSAALAQCLYAFGLFSRIFTLRSRKALTIAERQPVTVIICAKDEAANLRRNLPQIMAQRYTNDTGKQLFEVIVVNDCSADDTELVLQELEHVYDNLWHVSILPTDERCFQGKKFALSKGVEHAGNNLLLLTDADCTPSSEHWMERMVQPLNEGKEIVAGYGKYRPGPGLLNAFTRWETLHTFLQYSTYTVAGHPYMAVGRNLACTKDILLKAQATEVWNKLPSGDDDLLVSTMATKENMAIICDEQAFTLTDAKPTWASWFAQKQRHLSTGKYYRKNVQTLLGLYAFSHLFMWVLFFVLLVCGVKGLLFLLAVRCAAYWTLWTVAAVKLKETAIIPLFPLFDIGWMLYNFAFSPFIFLKNKTQWK